MNAYPTAQEPILSPVAAPALSRRTNASPKGGATRPRSWATHAAHSSSQDRARWLARHVMPHEPALRAWLARRLAAGLEVDDIVQETYALLAGLAAVEHIDSPRAYAFRTAQSLIQRAVRRTRIATIEAVADIEELNRAADEPSPENQVCARQELRQLSQLIAELPLKCRQAFTLRRVNGLSQRDVAGQMGISEAAVEKHIGRALRTLKPARAA